VGKERIRTHGSRAHATQKPEALLYRVIASSTNPGDVVLDPFFGSGTTGAVAKGLGRHWIGIEQDAEYIRIANERLEAAHAAPEDTLRFAEPRRQPRIPFGTLIEAGLLHPGQVLFFGSKDGLEATVLANGTVRCGALTGSIHQVASQLAGAPCNGWEQWDYVDEHTGRREPLDTLRKLLRSRLEEKVEDASGGS
jgi:modification methylase